MAGILDTFYYLFEADAKALIDGVREGEKQGKKLGDTLSHTDKQAQQLGKNLTDAVKSAVKLGAAFLSYQSLKNLVLDTAAMTEQMGYAAQAAHVGVEQFSAWSSAAESMGGSADGLANSMKALAKYGRDPIETLKALQGRFEGLSKIQATRLGERFGLDMGTINMLQMGKNKLAEFIERRKELGVVTEEQLQTSKEFQQQMRDTGQIWTDLGRRIAVALMPYAEKFLKFLENTARFIRDNKQTVIAFFAAVGAAILAYYLPAMISAAAATLVAIGPFLLIAAAVVAVAAAFALAYDDVQNFLAGNASVIGELSKKWPMVGELVRDFVAILKVMWLEFQAIVGFMSDLILKGPIVAFQNLGEAGKRVFDAIAERFPKLAAIFTEAGEMINKVGESIGGVWQIAIDWVSKAIDIIGKLAGLTKDTLEGVGKFFGLIPEEEQQPGTRPVQVGANGKPITGDEVPTVEGGLSSLPSNQPQPLPANLRPAPKPAPLPLPVGLRPAAPAVAVAPRAPAPMQPPQPTAASPVPARPAVPVQPPQPTAASPVPARPAVPVQPPQPIVVRPAVRIEPPQVTPTRAAPPAVPTIPPQTNAAMQQGKEQLRTVETSPLAAQTSNSITNSTRNNSKQTNVTVEKVEVNTQATDGDGVAAALSNGLSSHIKGAIDQQDDGIAA